jgi:hypothetical protein
MPRKQDWESNNLGNNYNLKKQKIRRLIMAPKKPKKPRTTSSSEPKLDYAKLMVNENYTNKQIA